MSYNFRYSGINYNDFNAGPGICVSVFTQGCKNQDNFDKMVFVNFYK